MVYLINVGDAYDYRTLYGTTDFNKAYGRCAQLNKDLAKDFKDREDFRKHFYGGYQHWIQTIDEMDEDIKTLPMDDVYVHYCIAVTEDNTTYLRAKVVYFEKWDMRVEKDKFSSSTLTVTGICLKNVDDDMAEQIALDAVEKYRRENVK